jgi:hypothetical protein
MARHEQCEYCGAVLLPEDEFCGECGAPRPEATSPVPPDARPTDFSPADRPETAPEPVNLAGARPSAGGTTGWRAAFVVLLVVGCLICLFGILVFLLFGLTEADGWTTGENWAFSAFCCLLPIGGAGLVLLMAGAGIWYARLRKL